MDKIMAELNKKFAGQSAARLTTYAGKMDLLTAAAANAQEIIGKSLLDALTRLGNDNSIASATKSMENFATATSEVITGLSVIISKLKLIGNVPGVDAEILKNLPYVGPALRAIQGLRTVGRENTPSQFNTVARPSVAEIGTQLKLLKAKKDELALLNKKNAIENKNVEELKKKFDLERIGINAALNNATDEETKLRLKAQLAILDNNEALAKKYLAELEAAEALKKLADAANKAANALGTFDPARFRMGENKDLGNDTQQLLAAFAAMQALSAGMIPKGLTGGTTQAAETLGYGQNYSDISRGTLGGSVFDPSFVRRGESQDLKITVDVSQTGDRFAALIAESLQIAQKSGISYGIAGGL
jgi:hypothetical protein